MTTPPAIRQLDDSVANKIAAGEVVERPAAVVKELVENSIDAGASSIQVRIEDGGARLVEVIDNGHGMRPEDLPIALGRHATSKLTSVDDLFHIVTLGFRGEALPSIAAVSEFELASRPHDAEGGHLLRLSGGRALANEATAMAPGTRVSVRNLFWNVPARLKFLKSSSAESGHVSDQVQRLALAHPDISFSLDVNERRAIEYPADESLRQRIRSGFGRGLAEHLIAVAEQRDGMEISGFIAHPSQAKASARRQFVFLNGRYIKDKLIIAAVREGFKGFLEPRLQPAVFVLLDIDPSQIDVNVHPTKAEVRFRNERSVFALVRGTIRDALETHAGGFSLFDSGAAAAPRGSGTLPEVERQRTVHASSEAPIQERFLPQSPATRPEPSSPSASPETTPVPAAPVPAQQAREAQVSYANDDQRDLPGVRQIVQLNDMYLLVETDQGIRLVDQHALHEKAIFCSLDPAISDFSGSGQQELLVPKSIDVSAAEMATLAPLLEELAPFGIVAEAFGPSTVLVRAHPVALSRTNWDAFFSDLAADGSSERAIERLRERIAHHASCRQAVKAGRCLSEEEQQELVRVLYEMEHMEHCPHGRPTTLDLSWGELERRFQR